MAAERIFSIPELVRFQGKDDTPIYVALRGVVYDVSTGRGWYGPGSSYSLLAGHDASFCLAKMPVRLQNLRN